MLSDAAHCKADVWRPLGIVQQRKCNLQSDKRKLSTSAKTRNYYAQLQTMLKACNVFRQVLTQDFKMLRSFFGKCVWVDLLCPILLIAVDTPAADKLCEHYSSYTLGVQRVICSCNVPFSDFGQRCQKKTQNICQSGGCPFIYLIH
jgi:hypothetical protein